MKKLLFVLLFNTLCILVSGQGYQNPTFERVTADGITYEKEDNGLLHIYSNVSYTLLNAPFVNKDGSPASSDWEIYDPGDGDEAAFFKIVRETFTAKEFADFKAANVTLAVPVVYNSDGEVIELSFIFTVSEAVKSLPVERIAELERRIKKEVTTRITDSATKELQYVYDVYDFNFKFM